jgi:hypothetical protein
MSSSPENADTTPVSTLSHLHKQQRKGNKVQDTPQARGRNTSRYELGRRNKAGEKVTRIYPREMYVVQFPVQRMCRLLLLRARSCRCVAVGILR